MSEDPLVSVVLPAFAEEHAIGETVAAVREELGERLGEEFEIVVVDDGSQDSTAAVAERAGADRVIRHVRNLGKGAAVRTGVLAARGRFVVFMDADLAYSPDHITRVLDDLLAGADVVIGSRQHPESVMVRRPSGLRSLGSRLVNLITRAVLSGGYSDTQAGLKGFTRDAARKIFSDLEITGMGFDVEVLHRAETLGLEVREIPVRLADPGRSSVRLVRDGIRLVWDVARVAWRRSRRIPREAVVRSD